MLDYLPLHSSYKKHTFTFILHIKLMKIHFFIHLIFFLYMFSHVHFLNNSFIFFFKIGKRKKFEYWLVICMIYLKKLHKICKVNKQGHYYHLMTEGLTDGIIKYNITSPLTGSRHLDIQKSLIATTQPVMRIIKLIQFLRILFKNRCH